MMRRAPLLRTVLLLAALFPAVAGAQPGRQVPPLRIPGPPPTPAPVDSSGLRFRITDADERSTPPRPAPPTTLLSRGQAARILARMPDIAADTVAADAVAFPARTLPPPRTGQTITQPFPPTDSLAPARPDAPARPAPLAIVRAAPRGPVPVGAEVTVTFSQPMVPLSSVSTVEADGVPVRISPMPAGTWRWLDVRTAVFTARGAMPSATRYTVTIPAGTASRAGGRLAEEVAWTFETPPAVATGALPMGRQVRRDPLFLVQFDQRVDAAAVLRHVRVDGPSGTIPVRAATEAEIAADGPASNLARYGEAGTWVAFRAAAPLPYDSEVRVVLPPGLPSAEGPLATTEPQWWSFRTYGPLRLVGTRCGYDGCRPGDPFVLRFSNPVDSAASGLDAVRVEPALPGMRLVVRGEALMVLGRAAPHTRYTVHVPATLTDVFGQRLERAVRDTFRVVAPRPELFGFPRPMLVLDPGGPRRIGVFSHDVARLRVLVHRVEPSDWPAFGPHGHRDPHRPLPGRRVIDSIVEIRAGPGEVTETVVDLDEVLRGAPGQLVVSVSDPEDPERRTTSAWVQATGIGVAALVDAGRVLAWATSLRDGTPVAGARVCLLSGGGCATADADGLASLPLPDRTPTNRDDSAVLIAAAGADTAMLAGGPWRKVDEGASVLWHGFTDRNLYRPGEEVRFKGFARELAPIRRDVRLLPATAGTRVRWTAMDPRGNEIASGTAAATALGGFDGTFTVPAGVNLGYARIRVFLEGREGDAGEIPFQVQEFRRPEFEVSMDGDAGPHVVGGSAEVSVRASYFAGGGLPGAPVAWRAVSQPASFTPPGWGAWHFGTHPWWWWGGSGGRSVVRTHEGTTDASGRHAVRLHFDGADPPRPHTVQVTATVVDVNRQPWTTSTSLLVHPADVYAGLRVARSWIDADDSIEVEVVAVDRDGRVVTGRPVTLVAARMQGWGESATVEGSEQVCEVVSGPNPARCVFRPGEGGIWRVRAEVRDAAGRLSRTETRVWVTGGAARIDRPDQPMGESREVRLIPDRETYAPGDTARILVQLPFWPARGVMTVRRGTIVHAEAVASDEQTMTVSVPIGEDDIPTVAVHVDVVGTVDASGARQPTARGTDFGTGSVTLAVPPDPRALTVDLAPADSVMGPDAPTSVAVTVRGADGRPVADAEVALVVVDEAVLALTGYRLANPLDLFHPSMSGGYAYAEKLRAAVLLWPEPAGPGTVSGVVVNTDGQPVAGALVMLVGMERGVTTDASGRFVIRGVAPGSYTVRVARAGMATAEMPVTVGEEGGSVRITLTEAALQLEEMVVTGVAARARGYAEAVPAPSAPPAPPAPPPPPVGKAAPAIAMRTNFDPLALWAPVVRTDADGTARIPFTLPSNLTRYRVMAVAVHGPRRAGTGESTITARRPLMVRPSPPRFLNHGDRFELPVVVQNQTGRAMEVRVAARGVGIAFTEPGRRVVVPAHDRVEVRLAAEALRAGPARVQVAAVSGDDADAAEVAIPVRVPATAEAFATYGSLTDGAVQLPLEVPADALPGYGGLEVTTSSTALQELTDALLYLVSYPFDCAEQIASRILAVASLRDVLTAFEADGLPPPEALADSVQRDIALLREMQRPDGGFAFWRGEASWPYVSLHATHALLRAREKGYAVPDEMLRPALDHVAVIERHIPSWYGPRARYALRSYAAYVLDRAEDGRTDGRLASLFASVDADTIPLEAAGWLLSAAHGRPRFAAESADLLRIVDNRATETASTATFATRYEDGEYLLLHSDRRTDGVVLEALLEADPRNPLVTKAVRGLLGHRTRGRWGSTQENAWVLLAMDRYFHVYEGETPEFVARMWLGGRFAGEQAFTGRSADRQHLDVPMRWLAENRPEDVVLSVEGPGRLYYRAGLRYAPADLDLAPLDRGFAVERTYEAVDDEGDVVRGEDGRWRVKAGARVRITVTMTVPSRRVHVALVDPLPAGFEAVNAALRGAERDPRRETRRWEPGLYADVGWWWYGPWYAHHNLRDDRAEAFAPLVHAGVYTYTYMARATTPGLFIVPPPRAEEMYSPETFGRGGTERVIVEAP